MVKGPSERQISQACDPYQLVYVRTTNVRSAIDLKSRLGLHTLYRYFNVFSIFLFFQDTWEVLVDRKTVNESKDCAEACGCVIEEDYHPAMPTSSANRFDSFMRAHERLIARAVFAQLIAREGQDLEAQIASVYSKMVDLYRCCDAFEEFCAIQSALDTVVLSPGWSCVVGISYSIPWTHTERSIGNSQFRLVSRCSVFADDGRDRLKTAQLEIEGDYVCRIWFKSTALAFVPYRFQCFVQMEGETLNHMLLLYLIYALCLV